MKNKLTYTTGIAFTSSTGKVYCSNCKYFEYGWFEPDKCLCPKNIEVKEEDWYDKRKRYKSYNFTPSKLNGDNYCKYYRRKWYKFWIK